jgi:hypothetical protein
VHAVAAAASSLQVVVTVGDASDAVNVAETGDPVTEPFAGDVIVTTGMTVSTVKHLDAEVRLPAMIAVTTTQWLPCDRPE